MLGYIASYETAKTKFWMKENQEPYDIDNIYDNLMYRKHLVQKLHIVCPLLGYVYYAWVNAINGGENEQICNPKRSGKKEK